MSPRDAGQAERLITRDSLLEALTFHVGERYGVSAAKLAAEITGIAPPNPAGERRLRQVIEDLRLEGHHICGHPSSGYFIAESEAELVRTCEYLHSRAMTSLRQVARMRGVAAPDLRGQLRLPT